MSALTLASKVKEEDEDAMDGVDESSTVIQTMQYSYSRITRDTFTLARIGTLCLSTVVFTLV